MLDAFELRREDLYEQVWAEPVSKVGAKYGITGTALSKICRKAGIPVPPVGYWQRLQYGYEPERPILPSPPNSTANVIRIEKRPPKPVSSPEVQTEVAREDDEKNRMRVAERLARPHPLVRLTADALRGQKPDDYGMLRRPWKEKCLDLRVSPQSLPRALRIMDALLKALEARGFKAAVGVGDGEKTGTSIELHGEHVAVALEEKSKREDHVLTKDERERKAKYSWSSAPRWDYHPSGTLQFQIKEIWGKAARKTWSDGRTPLEDALNDVIAGLIVVAEAKRLERLERQREHEAWVESERRRVKEEERRREEAERLKALEQEAAAWTKGQEIAAYADAVERGALKRGRAVEEGSRTHAWLAWARAHAARLDPVGRILAALDTREDAATPSGSQPGR